MKELRSLHRRFRRRVPGDDVDFFKRFGRVFFLWWIEYVVLASRLQLRTAEGDEMVFATAVFDVRDREAVERALASHPDLDRQDDGSYAWFEPGGSEEFRRGLGWFILDEGRVVLETTSRPRAERGRALLEALAGDAVRYRATSFESVERARERRPAKPPRESDEVRPEVEAEILGGYYDQHYRAWVDTALPALGGQTPREAARSKTGRPKAHRAPQGYGEPVRARAPGRTPRLRLRLDVGRARAGPAGVRGTDTGQGQEGEPAGLVNRAAG